MFESLSERFEGVFRKIRSRGKLSEPDVKDALREIRRALLEADVNYKVAKDFISRVQEKAVGQEVLRSVTPDQQVTKIVYDELRKLMGDNASDIKLSGIPPTVVMMVGLHGSGKTTTAAKLANYFKSHGRFPMLVAADIYRPAAVDQIKVLGRSLGIPVFEGNGSDPVAISKEAVASARASGRDMVILDTAGRLHIDEPMMDELKKIKESVDPDEILLVADSMAGQDAVNMAAEFLKWLDFDGVFLTKLDGDARGGAALSIKYVTGRPVKFVGVGEKLDAIEVFHPDRMASRMLGMGDAISFVEKVQKSVDLEKARKLDEKLRKESFSFEDFVDQLQEVKKMGPLDQLLGLIPGFGKAMKGIELDEKAITRTEAIIRSMTPEERRKPHIINGSRRRRIANGSGTTVHHINLLLKQFEMMKKMVKNMESGKYKKIRGFPL